MYISQRSLERALKRLETLHPFFGTSFLAFKEIGLPVGERTAVVFSRTTGDFLNRYYRAASTFEGFYSPFLTSDKTKRWNSRRYPSTSLQRITVDTFGDAFIHPKNSKTWGWRQDYIERLEDHLAGDRIPVLELACWLYRVDKLPADCKIEDLEARFLEQFHIKENEAARLLSLGQRPAEALTLRKEPLTERELLGVIGRPPGAHPEGGAALSELRLRGTGPARELVYQPSERLNLITGDNSLGKTFLLECIYWALSGEWVDLPAHPSKRVEKQTPRIDFKIAARHSKAARFSATYDWAEQVWRRKQKESEIAGLVLYARYDGSFAIWDPVRRFAGLESSDMRSDDRKMPTIRFRGKEDVFYGLRLKEARGWLCNGLIRDWIMWQISGERYSDRWEALCSSLRGLSPGKEVMEPGEPEKLPFDDQEIPTIRMSYGNVPIVLASAGVQRAASLAYLLVWTWYQHVELCSVTRQVPQRRLVVLIDEIEAHLHPRWQRGIVPSVMNVLSNLASDATTQLHIATHSPLVMAAAEAVFMEDTDDLHHLRLEKGAVKLEELEFVRRGRADLWLMSEVFGLEHPRSLPAEEAIEEAVALQREKAPDEGRIREAHRRLVQVLAQDDDFWPRWTYFARKHGALLE